MPVPHIVAKFNKRVTGRFIEPIARRFSWFAVVHHVGRLSGRAYATPVRLFSSGDDRWIVVLTYGRRADWVQNVLAQHYNSAPVEVEDHSGRWIVDSAVVIDRAAGVDAFSPLVRLGLRILRIHELLLIARDEATGNSATTQA